MKNFWKNFGERVVFICMIYKISEDQVERVMKSLLDMMGIKVGIQYWNDNGIDSISGTVYLYKDNKVVGYSQGYEFFFKYDKRFNKLTSNGNYPKLQGLDFFKMLPEEVVTLYFTDKVQEYLAGFIDRGSSNLKRVIREETKGDSTNYQLQVKLIKSLLDSASFEGVCDYNFTWDEDRVSSVILKFSSKWYRSSDDRYELNRKLETIHTTKVKVKEMVNNYLNIKDIYVGSYLEDCEL